MQHGRQDLEYKQKLIDLLKWQCVITMKCPLAASKEFKTCPALSLVHKLCRNLFLQNSISTNLSIHEIVIFCSSSKIDVNKNEFTVYDIQIYRPHQDNL